MYDLLHVFSSLPDFAGKHMSGIGGARLLDAPEARSSPEYRRVSFEEICQYQRPMAYKQSKLR